MKSVSLPVCEKKRGGEGTLKNTESSPFYCSRFPLVVFIFTGQSGCEGRLQGFGDREAEQEGMDGDGERGS